MRKRHAILLGFGILLGIGSLVILLCNALADTPRLTISIFKYGGITTPKQEKEFGAFKDIIIAKIVKLTQELEAKGSQFSYVSSLRANFVHGVTSDEHLPFRGSGQDLYDHWYSSGALQVMWGRIRSSDSKSSVRSEIFLGDLKGALDAPSLTLDLPIVDEEFDTTRDSHTVTTLYALAMDAEKRGRPKDEVLMFLSEAYGRLPDLPQDIPGMKGLKEAILQSIKEAKKQ